MVNESFKQIITAGFDGTGAKILSCINNFVLVKDSGYEIWHMCTELQDVPENEYYYLFWARIQFMLDKERNCSLCSAKIPKQFLIQRRIMNIGV